MYINIFFWYTFTLTSGYNICKNIFFWYIFTVTSGYNKYENTLCSGEALLTSVNVSVTECEDLCDDTLACIAFSYIPTTQNCSIKGQCYTMEEQENITAYVKFSESLKFIIIFEYFILLSTVIHIWP